MNGIDQAAADRSVFFRHPRFRDMGLLKARFRRHRYALHTHPTYVIALITGGCERVRVDRQPRIAPAGSVIVVNPEACHDGEAGCRDGWAYRTFYPTVELMTEVARELGHTGPPEFPHAILTDPVLGAALADAHHAAEDGDAAHAEETMLLALRRLIIFHAGGQVPTRENTHAGSRRRVGVYRDMIEADLADTLDLAGLARASGVTRFQVIRDFKQTTGFTPSAFMRDRRVRRASRLIQLGETLANASSSAGFADQSHFSRAFKLSHGFTPGWLRRAAVRPVSAR